MGSASRSQPHLHNVSFQKNPAVISTAVNEEKGAEMSDEPLLYTKRDDAVAVVSINDDPLNRMSLAYVDQLEEVVADIADDDAIRAFVLTAEGTTNFSVGMNLKELGAGLAERGGPDAFFDQRLRVISRIETMGKPSVATLFGYCLGGGLELPLGCTFRVAAMQGAQIGLPEMDLGSIPAWGGSARLAKCVGRTDALDMILRAKRVSGQEALAIGLVSEVWPIGELKDRAIALAAELAAQPRLAVQAVLDSLHDSEDKTLDELLVAERRGVHATLGTADNREGMMAFLEKRRPVFNQD
jgi:enoyl-CoA hydratase/carnithine racemase